MSDHAADHLKNDSDRGKGSLEPDNRKQPGNNSMNGQLPHRHPHPEADGADSDFPEPGSSPEHSFEGEVEKKLPSKKLLAVSGRRDATRKTFVSGLRFSDAELRDLATPPFRGGPGYDS